MLTEETILETRILSRRGMSIRAHSPGVEGVVCPLHDRMTQFRPVATRFWFSRHLAAIVEELRD